MKRNGWLARMQRVATLTVAWLLIGCGSDGDPTDTPDIAGAHNEVLERLGLTTELGPRIDLDKQPVRESYNPLSAKRRQLHRLTEIYLAGVPSPAGGRHLLLGDSTEAYDLLPIATAENDWAELPKASTAGDFDGDGREEIALVLFNPSDKKLSLRTIEDKPKRWATAQIELKTLDSVNVAEGSFASNYLLDIGSADLDGDGKDEIYATCASSLLVMDDSAAQYKILLDKSFPAEAGAAQYLRVAGGDTDGDGAAEMIVVDGQVTSGRGTVKYYIYDELKELKSGTVEPTVDGQKVALMTADVSVGDVDGDRVGEIVFAGRQSETTDWFKVLIMDYAKRGDAAADYELLTTAYGYQHPYSTVPVARVETGDLDGDFTAEIVSYVHILKTKNGLLPKEPLAKLPDSDIALSTMVSIGDVTDDWKDDVVYLKGGTNDKLVIFGADAQGKFVQLQTMPITADLLYPTITAVNTDDDSAVLEFQSHKLLFTNPCVLAVMAAPPAYKSGMDLSSAGTVFGKGESTAEERATSMTFSTSFTVGGGVSLGIVDGSLGGRYENAVDKLTSEGSEVSKAYYYNGAGDSDKVVFTAIPFDVYVYKVLSSPVAAEVGATVTINVPRPVQTQFVDRDFYNENNGTFFDIGESVLGHTIGDPQSYPREASLDKAALDQNGGFYSETKTVGQGSGSQTIEISSSNSSSSGTEISETIAIQTQLSAAGKSFGINLDTETSFRDAHTYTISTTKSTFVQGTVGNIIKADEWSDKQFTFGLYVKPVDYEGQKFPVIGYWVD